MYFVTKKIQLDLLCINLDRVFEDNAICKYRYSTNATFSDLSVKSVSGELEIEKISGDVKNLSEMNGDSENQVFFRAKHRIRQHWRNNEFPESTVYAAG